MDWGLIWAEVAWQDIEETGVYIARDSQHYAEAFIRIEDAITPLF